MMDKALMILQQTDQTKIDLTAIPFDTFYMFLEQNSNFQQGKVVGDLLLKKFQKSFLPPQQDYLPVGIDPHWNAQKAMKQVDHVFTQLRNNQDLYRRRDEMTSNLMKSVYAYHQSLMGNTPYIVEKENSLQTMKTILQPFFTAELKQPDEPKPAKQTIWKRIFG